MKKILLSVLLVFYILIGVHAAKGNAHYDKYVRLHILANSNSSYDQAIKVSVKNYLFNIYKDKLQTFNSKDEAISFINSNKEDIKKMIDDFLISNNIDYKSEIRIVSEEYKKSAYKNISLPRGVYTSVKIVLGKGRGKNLFFIMYPSLIVKENITIKPNNKGKIIYKSKIMEILKD